MATAPQRTASAWDAFYADWVAPVVRFGTPALIVFVVLLVAVRLATRVVVGTGDESLSRRWNITYWTAVLGLAVVGIDSGVTLPLSFRGYERAVQAMLWITIALFVVSGVALTALFGQPRRYRDLAVYGGALFLAFALVGLAVYFPDQWHAPSAVLVWALLLALGAGLVAARVRGLHIGLTIQARNAAGADDAGIAEHVRARLHALGSQPPRGIQLSQATDVSTLPDGALALLPAGVFAKLGALVVQLVQPATPWHVAVGEEADGSISVVLTRNGKVAESVVIRRQTLALPDEVKEPAGSNLALRTAAAAFVLLALSRRHRTLRRGLGGATDWRSVALQVLATDPAVATAAVRGDLLANAVAYDAGNLAAWAALVQISYRGQGTDLDYDARLVDILDRADASVTPTDDLVPIRLRTYFNLAVIRLNRAISNPDLAPTALPAADESATRLQRLIAEARGRRELSALTAEIGTATWFLRASIHELDAGFEPPEDPEPETAMTPLAYYERACLRMLQDRPDAALDDLFVATRNAGMRTSAQTDRSFAVLHDREQTTPERVARFKHLVGDPVSADLFALKPVSRHRKRLQRNGILTVDELAKASISRLVDDVGVPAGEARALQELAMLHELVGGAKLVFLLQQLDIATRAQLRRELTLRTDLRADLLTIGRAFDIVVPTTATVVGWLVERQV